MHRRWFAKRVEHRSNQVLNYSKKKEAVCVVKQENNSKVGPRRVSNPSALAYIGLCIAHLLSKCLRTDITRSGNERPYSRIRALW